MNISEQIELIEEHNKLVKTDDFKNNIGDIDFIHPVTSRVYEIRLIIFRELKIVESITGLLPEITHEGPIRPIIQNHKNQQTINPINEASMEAKEVLNQCIVEGTVIKLPNIQLERKLYQEVAKSLELIGGKWKGGKIYGFVFPSDPTDLLLQIAGGEKRNLKKEFQFFGTPGNIAKMIVSEAFKCKTIGRVLEPSAGRGAIISAIHEYDPEINVHYYELMDINRTFLEVLPKVTSLGNDFLAEPTNLKFTQIIANPPFSKNQDIDHILHMYELLEDGGRLVSIASPHWEHSSGKKETHFRNWLESIGADIKEIPAGKFRESGTNIETRLIIIDK